MPTTKQLTAYARVLLQKGLNLQKGQTLVINAPVESHDFVALLTKEAYTAGGPRPGRRQRAVGRPGPPALRTRRVAVFRVPAGLAPRFQPLLLP